MRRGLVVLGALALAGALAAPAQATHGTNVCAGALDYSMCIAVVDEIEARGDQQTARLDDMLALLDGTGGTDGGVVLSETNTNQQELVWWGAWALVGLGLALLSLPPIVRLLGERS